MEAVGICGLLRTLRAGNLGSASRAELTCLGSMPVKSFGTLKHLRNFGGLAFVLLALVVIFSRLPLGTALEFVEDERYEVMKAYLCVNGYTLYKDIWRGLNRGLRQTSGNFRRAQRAT